MKTKIEWCDYTINPVKGLCPMACPYCYARRMYKRFKWNPEIRYTDPGFTIAELLAVKKPSKIFWGSTMELFWGWPEIWMRDTFTIIKQFPQHTHIFLTKRPENLPIEFPENCWVGVSATDYPSFSEACNQLYPVEARVKFISFEPLLDLNGWGVSNIYEWFHRVRIDWVIIGQQTPVKQATMPKIEWVAAIVEAASKAGIPIFLKNNLESLIHHEWQDNVYAKLLRTRSGKLRQEFPDV